LISWSAGDRASWAGVDFRMRAGYANLSLYGGAEAPRSGSHPT
jgi:hypothetical protein